MYIKPALFTLRQTRLSFGDAVYALNSECPRLIHQQHGVSVQLHLQHSPLHPHHGDQQRATPTRSDSVCIPAGCPPVLRRPQLTGQHFDGRRTFLLFVCFEHDHLPLISNGGWKSLHRQPPAKH